MTLHLTLNYNKLGSAVGMADFSIEMVATMFNYGCDA
jgi:hypothetical protein